MASNGIERVVGGLKSGDYAKCSLGRLWIDGMAEFLYDAVLTKFTGNFSRLLKFSWSSKISLFNGKSRFRPECFILFLPKASVWASLRP